MSSPTNLSIKHAALLWVALLIVVSALSGCREPDPVSGNAPPATTTVASVPSSSPAAEAADRPTVAVKRQTLRRYAPAVGNLKARQTSKVGTQVSGRVKEVLTEVGDVVHKGQILVRIDPTFFELDVRQCKAAVEAAKGALEGAAADVADTDRELKRQLDIFERGAGSTKERDDATTAKERAAANHVEKAGKLAEAESRLAYVEEQLKETQVLAPYDGAVTARLIHPGEYAALMPPTPLLEIQETGVLYLEFSLPQELLDEVHPGSVIEFEVEGVGGEPGVSTVAVVFPAIDEATRSFRCRAIIDNQTGEYQPGLLARVKVVTGEAKDALVVPRTALSKPPSGWQATVTIDNQKVTKPVEIGLVADDWVQILSGLSEGDLVVAATSQPG
jgi:membrane fusion protein (multidrug efflux system)